MDKSTEKLQHFGISEVQIFCQHQFSWLSLDKILELILSVLCYQLKMIFNIFNLSSLLSSCGWNATSTPRHLSSAICLSEVEVTGCSSIQKYSKIKWSWVLCPAENIYYCRSRSLSDKVEFRDWRQTPERSLIALASTKVTISLSFTIVLKEFECITWAPTKLLVYSETMKKHPCLNSWRSWSTTSTYPTSAIYLCNYTSGNAFLQMSSWSLLRHPTAKVLSCASI